MSRGPLRGTRFEAWSPAQYSRISKLLDEVLALAPEARGTWLNALDRQDPQAAADLRDLLEPDERRVEGILAGAGNLADQLASLPEADRSLVGRQFGPYRVRSLLGHGGMGSVWLAERVDGRFERRVALKLVHTALMSLGIGERLSRECAILASLDHPNIARIFDAGVSADGQPYLALEYVAGTPLVTYCDDHRLPVRERLALFRQVLSAVRYAHAHLVIHRDLKPSNILVTDEGRVCLLDFGIAKLLSEGTAKETELTQLSGRALSPEYAAPEQMPGAPITIAADVYALGVVLYELLTGHGPYRLARHSRGALEEAILWAEVPLPSRAAMNEAAARATTTTVGRWARALRGDLDTIVMKALRKSPVERYATVDALDEDIARWFRGEPILARRSGLAYRAVKFARRHWVAVVVAAAFALMLVAGLAAMSYEARVAQRQRDAALQAQLRSLTQTADARLRDGDAAGALSIILEVLPHRGVKRAYSPEALAVFQEARAADLQILAFTRHADEVTSVDFSPDGQRLLTASIDHTARTWNAATGQELLVLRSGSDRGYVAALSPDGRRILTTSGKTARIWDTATGREMLQLKGHTDQIYDATFSPDGRYAVSTSRDRTARIWDTTSGLEVRQLEHGDQV